MADQESEDDLSASRTSLERQAPHRGNTMVHVCWHRNTSVSMVDFSVAVEVRTARAVLGRSRSPGRRRAVPAPSLLAAAIHAHRRVDRGPGAGGVQVPGTPPSPQAGVQGGSGVRKLVPARATRGAVHG